MGTSALASRPVTCLLLGGDRRPRATAIHSSRSARRRCGSAYSPMVVQYQASCLSHLAACVNRSDVYRGSAVNSRWMPRLASGAFERVRVELAVPDPCRGISNRELAHPDIRSAYRIPTYGADCMDSV